MPGKFILALLPSRIISCPLHSSATTCHASCIGKQALAASMKFTPPAAILPPALPVWSLIRTLHHPSLKNVSKDSSASANVLCAASGPHAQQRTWALSWCLSKSAAQLWERGSGGLHFVLMQATRCKLPLPLRCLCVGPARVHDLEFQPKEIFDQRLERLGKRLYKLWSPSPSPNKTKKQTKKITR